MINKQALGAPQNNDLLNTLMSRQMAPQPQPAQESVPAVPPSGGKTNTPPQVDRFVNAQKMMEAYRNGWSPNPLILRAALGNK